MTFTEAHCGVETLDEVAQQRLHHLCKHLAACTCTDTSASQCHTALLCTSAFQERVPESWKHAHLSFQGNRQSQIANFTGVLTTSCPYMPREEGLTWIAHLVHPVKVEAEGLPCGTLPRRQLDCGAAGDLHTYCATFCLLKVQQRPHLHMQCY